MNEQHRVSRKSRRDAKGNADRSSGAPSARNEVPASAAPSAGLAVVRESSGTGDRSSATGYVSGFKRCPSCSQRYPSDFRVCPRDATELELPPEDEDPLLGTILGDSYEIVRVIGEGGMGRVYEAKHQRLTRRYAVKVLHADLARQADIVSRFLREAEATSALSHMNIVEVVDVNRAPDGRPYIVAELLEGVMLADYFDKVKKLSVPDAVNICRQICAALAAAHERDIVHRDIKPENVFLLEHNGRRTVKVLDFGISRLGESANSLTKTGIVMGTPAYMPPEQARGARVDHRADIYAVGAILYEAVTGKPPFEGADLMATLAQVMSQEPARPCTLNAALPPALEMTIQRAMAKEPSERYRTMLELDAELASFDTGRASLPPGVIGDEMPTLPLEAVRMSLTDVDTTTGTQRIRQPSVAATRARSHILLLSVVAVAWTLGGLLDAATSGIRWARGVNSLSATELVLTVAGALALAIAPSIAWVRFVRHRIWPSTPRAVELVEHLRGVIVAALATYATGSLAVRVVEAVIHDDPSAVGWPGWAVLLFAAGNFAGIATWALERARRSAAVSG
jgi:serine/threonine-protein kinase